MGDIITGMLIRKANDRWSAEKCLNHPWFSVNAPQKDVELPKTIVKNLKRFRRVNIFKKAALHVIAQHMSTPQLAMLREIFVKLDTDNDGTLSLEEIQSGIQKAGL